MRRILKQGSFPDGHKVQYNESMWLWKNGYGTTMSVDGKVIDTITIDGHTMVTGYSVKIYGHVTVVNGRIQDDIYDYNHPHQILHN